MEGEQANTNSPKANLRKRLCVAENTITNTAAVSSLKRLPGGSKKGWKYVN
jgi:hypothetical protein